MAFQKEHIILTVGGVIASGAIGYLIYRAEAKDNAANTAAQIAASENEQQQQDAYLASLPAIQTPALAASTTNTSSGDIATATDNGGTPAPDPGLEALIAGFQSSPVNSVTLQSTPVAQIGALPAPAQIAVAPVVVPTVNVGSGSATAPTSAPNAGPQPILAQTPASLAV